MRALAFLVVAAVALAGCSDGKDAGTNKGTDGPGKVLPMLHGYVVDPAIRPLEGVKVTVLDTNASVTTDAGGYFGLDDLPIEQFLILVAEKEGFISASKQITLVPDTPVRLNFTLEQQPVIAASKQILEFEGFLGCQVGVVGPTGNSTTDCNMGLEQRNVWDFAVEGDLAGAVIEVFWDARTQAGSSLGLVLETLELGANNIILGDVVGTSPLQVVVPQSIAEKYYPQGGIMRLTVSARSDATQNEAGIGSTVVVQQPYQAFASLFYIEPPPGGYTLDP